MLGLINCGGGYPDPGDPTKACSLPFIGFNLAGSGGVAPFRKQSTPCFHLQRDRRQELFKAKIARSKRVNSVLARDVQVAPGTLVDFVDKLPREHENIGEKRSREASG